jgi:hypothetical protein
MKEIEKLLEKEDPVKKVEMFENKISTNLIKLEECQREELDIIENKKEIEKNIEDMNMLYKQFEDKFEKLEDYIILVKNTPVRENGVAIGNTIYPNNIHTINSLNSLNSFSPVNTVNPNASSVGNLGNICNNSKSNPPMRINKFEEINEINDYIFPSDNQEDYNSHNPNSNNNNSIYSTHGSTFSYSFTPREYSQRINSLFANSQIREASELWRKFNYLNFEGTSVQRSYEMLMYITRLKDREIEFMTRKISQNEEKLSEMKRKDAEIVELFAQMEMYKNKIKFANTKNEENLKLEEKMSN